MLAPVGFIIQHAPVWGAGIYKSSCKWGVFFFFFFFLMTALLRYNSQIMQATHTQCIQWWGIFTTLFGHHQFNSRPFPWPPQEKTNPVSFVAVPHSSLLSPGNHSPLSASAVTCPGQSLSVRSYRVFAFCRRASYIQVSPTWKLHPSVLHSFHS